MESNTNSTLAGKPAYMLVTSYTYNATNYKKMETGTIVGNVTYYITYETEAKDYVTFLPNAQRMIDSFQFSSAPPLTSTTPYYGTNETMGNATIS